MNRRPNALNPVVFQAAGPTATSIQSMVDAFRTAIGGVNNGNVAGPIDTGRREINRDGGGSTATSIVPTPFDGFLVNRGSRFTTRGDGFVQAPVEGLAATFNNTSYATEFKAFSPVRLFSPLDSNVTTAQFFVPSGGEAAATTKAFGAVFSDVDQQRNGDDHGALTVMLFHGAYGNLLYRAEVPASEGEASFSFCRRAVRRGAGRLRANPHRQRAPGSRRQQEAGRRHDGRLRLWRTAGDGNRSSLIAGLESLIPLPQSENRPIPIQSSNPLAGFEDSGIEGLRD